MKITSELIDKFNKAFDYVAEYYQIDKDCFEDKEVNSELSNGEKYTVRFLSVHKLNYDVQEEYECGPSEHYRKLDIRLGFLMESYPYLKPFYSISTELIRGRDNTKILEFENRVNKKEFQFLNHIVKNVHVMSGIKLDGGLKKCHKK